VPAAAVIPAPIAYIKVVAVKKLVVEILQPRIVLCHLVGVTVAVVVSFHSWFRLRF
jgi:hypothetical protein